MECTYFGKPLVLKTCCLNPEFKYSFLYLSCTGIHFKQHSENDQPAVDRTSKDSDASKSCLSLISLQKGKAKTFLLCGEVSFVFLMSASAGINISLLIKPDLPRSYGADRKCGFQYS